jgi:hypothetical protein
MDIVVNGLLIQIVETDIENCKNILEIKYPEGHWKRKKILIHDVIESGLDEEEVVAIVQYLYDEGFIEDRRMEYEVIRPTP